jgi:CTP:molybdopterin cytidylyltransferase MocA
MRAGVLLAAGASKRMGKDKALVRANGQMFVTNGVRHLWSACDVVVVVLGAHARTLRPRIEEEFARLVEHGGLAMDLVAAHRQGSAGLEVRFVTNPKWQRGMLSSVKTGLEEALRLRPSTVLVLPVDHPTVKTTTVSALAGAMDAALGAYEKGKKSNPFAYALVPRHKRHRGHPIALSPALARAIVRDAEASDLSDAMRRNARLIGYLDCTDPGVVNNRNTPRD